MAASTSLRDEMSTPGKTHLIRWLLPAALILTVAIYWVGLSGGWLFDDYPNIVDNPGVQPYEASVPALVRAALSSPASEFKRPLASLSFAANYLTSGLDPWSWKLVNLLIHLLNGLLVFVLAKGILRATTPHHPPPPRLRAEEEEKQTGILAMLIATGWMLLPINLTAVLYVVQREESMANLFVLLGLIGYTMGRRRMLCSAAPAGERKLDRSGFWLCAASLILPTAVGLLAKETAVMLPLYALLIEWIVFRFEREASAGMNRRIAGLFVCVLLLPLVIGLTWLLPGVLNPAYWATRDFTLHTRLLSEARVLCDYLIWTLLPTPHALSFYHDGFRISVGLLSPWTTLVSLLFLAALVTLVFVLRRRQPQVALGIALFLGCHLLTGTILPLELVYEHRNYFASFGVLLAVVPLLVRVKASATEADLTDASATTVVSWRMRNALGRYALLAALMLWWTSLTAITAYAWGDPLRLAQDLATRAPNSPRAQYELGRTYIIYSHYDPASRYTRLAYAPLEKAAGFPESSILPQQALIFMNSRMGLPLKAAWWDSMIAKLKARKPGVQDESSLAALSQCARDEACPLPADRMVQAFEAALAHPSPSARLQATYGDYAWNVLDNHALGESMMAGAVKTSPNEPAYHITLARMLAAEGNYDATLQQIRALQALNIGGRLDREIANLRVLLPASLH